MRIEGLSDGQFRLLAIAVIWDMIWKGFAMWKAARNYHQNWFISLMIFNTIGILPIIYLLTHKNGDSEAKE